MIPHSRNPPEIGGQVAPQIGVKSFALTPKVNQLTYQICPMAAGAGPSTQFVHAVRAE